MANIVLYRKYRPTSFSEVVGQELVIQTLKNAVLHNMISHAYLFSGPRGTGKTTLARLLAKAVNCEHPNKGEPCNACVSCNTISKGTAMDLIEIDAASNRGIDDIRELKEGMQFAPTQLKYKVFVIDEAHQLTKEAANALLKILEEPPSHVIFVLATTQAHKMIPTIVSRCQRFDFHKLSVKEIAQQLISIAIAEGAALEPEATLTMAAAAGGSLRDAVGLLDKVLTFLPNHSTTEKISSINVKALLGIVDTMILQEFTKFLAKRDAGGAIELLNKNLQEGMDPYEFMKGLMRYLRHILAISVAPRLANTLEQDFTLEEQHKIEEMAAQFKTASVGAIVDLFLKAENQMKFSSIVQLPIELAIIDACSLT